MNCQEARSRIPDRLMGELPDGEARDLQAHVGRCDACRRELEHLSFLWTKLGVLPEERPSERLRGRFYGMLEAKMKHEKKRVSLADWIRGWWPQRPALQLAMMLLVAAAGLGAGFLIRPAPPAGDEVARLRGEVDAMRNTVAVSLLNQASAIDRLSGVQWTSRIPQPDDSTLETLLDILETDPNVNVRLAAVDALFLFSDRPQVKEGIVAVLPGQDSPLVQVALVDLLVGIKEKRALRAFEELIRNKKLVPDVKNRVEQGIRTLT